MTVKMPVALASSVPRGLVQPLIQNMLNFKLKHEDPLLHIGQKKCMVGAVEVSGRAGSLFAGLVVGRFGFQVSQVSTSGTTESC